MLELCYNLKETNWLVMDIKVESRFFVEKHQRLGVVLVLILKAKSLRPKISKNI